MKLRDIGTGFVFFLAMCAFLLLALWTRKNAPLEWAFTLAAAACFCGEVYCFFRFLWRGGDKDE